MKYHIKLSQLSGCACQLWMQSTAGGLEDEDEYPKRAVTQHAQTDLIATCHSNFTIVYRDSLFRSVNTPCKRYSIYTIVQRENVFSILNKNIG